MFGDVCDAINAILYFIEGSLLDAIISIGCIIFSVFADTLLKPLRWAGGTMVAIAQKILQKLPDFPSGVRSFFNGIKGTVKGIWLIGESTINKILSAIDSFVAEIVSLFDQAKTAVFKNSGKEVSEEAAEEIIDLDYWEKHMSPEDAKKHKQRNDQVKAGWTAEERYNYQLYGHPNGSSAYRINIADSHSISTTGAPNTITRKLDANGNIIQDRIYGSDGRVIKDIDYYHNEKPGSHYFPHEHIWDWTQKNPRQ